MFLYHHQVDSEELLRSEAVALRVRGTLNLTSGQNENDLHIAFKHLIEKVGRAAGCINVASCLVGGYSHMTSARGVQKKVL